MPKTLAVFGATGQQGSSVVNCVLNDRELSREYKIRAITRDINSEKAKRLSKRSIEVVQGDMLDGASLETALAGANTVFAMTQPSFGPDGAEVEYNIGKRIADVAVQKGVEYFIFSTLPPVTKISGGKYTKVAPFDAKARIEEYIRGLPIKSAFCLPEFFMENFHTPTFLPPRRSDNDTWVISSHGSSQVRLALVDATNDTGKFIGAILAEPDKYEGKTLLAATVIHSLEEIAAIMSNATGKNVIYRQIPLEEFQKALPPFAVNLYSEGFSFLEEFEYFGPGTDELAAWSVENARGKFSTFKEYLEAHPLQLQ